MTVLKSKTIIFYRKIRVKSIIEFGPDWIQNGVFCVKGQGHSAGCIFIGVM